MKGRRDPLGEDKVPGMMEPRMGTAGKAKQPNDQSPRKMREKDGTETGTVVRKSRSMAEGLKVM